MDKYTQAVIQIIKEQEQVVGPIAFDLAKSVSAIHLGAQENVSIDGDPKTALENLVLQYQRLFGRASVEVSKEAIKKSNIIFGPVDLPTILN